MDGHLKSLPLRCICPHADALLTWIVHSFAGTPTYDQHRTTVAILRPHIGSAVDPTWRVLRATPQRRTPSRHGQTGQWMCLGMKTSSIFTKAAIDIEYSPYQTHNAVLSNPAFLYSPMYQVANPSPILRRRPPSLPGCLGSNAEAHDTYTKARRHSCDKLLPKVRAVNNVE